MDNYPSWCYINKNYKKIPFTPEKKIEELPYQKKLWDRTFPKKKGVDISKLKLSNIGRYSVTKLNVTEHLQMLIPQIYNLIEVKSPKDLVVTESNGGLGGMTIQIGQMFKKINVVEIIAEHAKIIKHNTDQYGLTKKVKIHTADYMDVMYELKQDIIISDPPWGGTNYYKIKALKLHLNNIDITCIINDLYDKNLFKLYVLITPTNFDIKHFTEKIKSDSIFIQKYDHLNVIFILNVK
jgi:16S rRNA G966 N2-methylase RsmD